MDITPLGELLNLKGKTAIVTGAVGIGFGISHRLTQAGASVVIASRNEEEVKEIVSKLTEKGFKAKGVRTDVSSEEEVRKMVKETGCEASIFNTQI